MQEEGIGLSESEQQSMARGSVAKLQGTCESKDGGRLLGFYILEADEENRGIGFANHQSMEKL